MPTDPAPEKVAALTAALDEALSAVDDEWTVPELADLMARELDDMATPHRLMMPPHPGGYYVASALCSCGDWQYDADSTDDLFGLYRHILHDHTSHAAGRRAIEGTPDAD